jgi:hypothetical protein
MDEPEIIINSVYLTQAQAMTVRVALQSFAITLEGGEGLGEDETGKAIARGYLTAIGQVNEIMMRS